LDPEFGLDTRDARNLLTLAAIRQNRVGGFSNTILVDQHSYLDLRAFFVAGLNPVYINAESYRRVIGSLPRGRYLALFSKGTPEIEPRWAGAWPPNVQACYAEEMRFLSGSPVVWQRDGSVERLLDWAPPAPDNNVSLVAIRVGQ
jgi:hypothetical protein